GAVELCQIILEGLFILLDDIRGGVIANVGNKSLQVKLDDIQGGYYRLPLRGSLGRTWRNRRQRAEQSMTLAKEAGREVDLVCIAAALAVADLEGPQSIDLDRLTVWVVEFRQERTGRGVVCMDVAIAEVAHQERSGQRTKTRRRNGESPGGIELT